MHSSLTRLQTRISTIVSGMYGDWLAERGNPLAVRMRVLHDGVAVNLQAPEIESPQPTLIVLVHGLMGSETIWTYAEKANQNYATDLAEDLAATPLCLRYNSGRAIAANGADFNAAMQALVASWPVPVERMILVGHSMGGLVIRSACHKAMLNGNAWVDRVRQCVYLATPHGGSWLANGAKQTAGLMRTLPRDYLRAVGEAVDARSQGIQNLARNDVSTQAEREWPLLAGSQHYSISGCVGHGRFNPARLLVGDGLVHEASARGGNDSDQGMTDHAAFAGIGHIRLAHHPAVGQQLRDWLL